MLATLARAADPQNARLLFPGVVACAVAAAAAGFLGEHYGAPVLLFALLLGLAMNFLGEQGPCRPGIEFCAKTVLRIGVALLGLRITLAQAAALGWGPLLLVLICVAATIALCRWSPRGAWASKACSAC